MREVPANSDTLLVAFGSRPVASRELVAKLDMAVNVVADRLDAAPAAADAAERRPGQIRQPLGVAIATAQQIHQRLVGKPVQRDLFGMRRNLVGQSAILDDELVPKIDLTDRGDKPRADVAEPILVVPERNVRRHPDGMVRQKVALP